MLIWAGLIPHAGAAIDIDIELTYHSSLHDTKRILDELTEERTKAEAMCEAELKEKKRLNARLIRFGRKGTG